VFVTVWWLEIGITKVAAEFADQGKWGNTLWESMKRLLSLEQDKVWKIINQ
jgi:hypothetical protein